MKNGLSLAVLVLSAVPVLADDAKPPVHPTEPAKPVAPAKQERKSSPEAEAILKRYAGLLHFPSPAHKTLSMQSHCDMPSFGGEVGCTFAMKEGDVALDIVMPEAMRKNAGNQLERVTSYVKGMVGQFFKPFLVPADAMALQYDVVAKEEKGQSVVELTRFDEKAAWESARLYFSKDGLLEKQVGIPNLDPNDPMAAMNAGSEVEITFDYKKRGELYTIEGGKMFQPMGETDLKFTYYEVEAQAPLPKALEITSALFGPEPLVVSLHDFVIDGKAVPATARKVETPAATPPAKEPVPPAEPPKPGSK